MAVNRSHPFGKEMERLKKYYEAQHIANLIFKAIERELKITRSMLQEPSRKRLITDARAIYFLLMEKAGYIKKLPAHFINRVRTSSNFYIKRGFNLLDIHDGAFVKKYTKTRATFEELKKEIPAPKHLHMTNRLLFQP